jgi:hypothetical protein
LNLLEQIPCGQSGIPKWTHQGIPVDDGERKPALEGRLAKRRRSNLRMNGRIDGHKHKSSEYKNAHRECGRELIDVGAGELLKSLKGHEIHQLIIVFLVS